MKTLDKVWNMKQAELVGDEVICIDNIGYDGKILSLTIGKKYTITDFYSASIRVVDDSKINCEYQSMRFVLLQDWREKQLDNILL
jgi:hypothetical protein